MPTISIVRILPFLAFVACTPSETLDDTATDDTATTNDITNETNDTDTTGNTDEPTETTAGPANLQMPTATFSQPGFGGFGIAEAIDGETPPYNMQNGWGIDPQEVDQTAAFETVQDTPNYANGTRLTFTLVHDFLTEHALGCFRLSVTTADRADFADGNEGLVDGDPGDVGDDSIWTVLTPGDYSASTGALMALRPDNAVLVQDLDSTEVTYTIVADTALTGITGIRLEALEDPSLPQGGPGLQNANGNFALVEFTVGTEPM